MHKFNKGYRHLRKGRFSEVGYVYHVTFSTKDRRPIFDDFFLSRKLILILKDDQNLGYTQTYAFFVMPDHVHWLFELENGSLSNAVKRIKALFSKYTSESIWNTGFYDHAIRSGETLIDVARYIIANPLRAGIVDSVKDYPHWDSI